MLARLMKLIQIFARILNCRKAKLIQPALEVLEVFGKDTLVTPGVNGKEEEYVLSGVATAVSKPYTIPIGAHSSISSPHMKVFLSTMPAAQAVFKFTSSMGPRVRPSRSL